jgi:2-hydroxymuconate-semialdehyde hydrolase
LTDLVQAGHDVVVDGQPTHYHDAGAGEAVPLIHGSGPGVSAWANWRLVIPALAERFRVIAHDQVGFNETRPPDGVRYGRQLWTRHALRLMEELGIQRYSIVGNSMGGAIALSMADEAPERVAKLVLMGTMGIQTPLPSGLNEVWGYEPSVEAMARMVDLFAYNKAIATPELIEMRYRSSIAPGIQEAFSSMFPAPRQRWLDDLALPEERLRQIAQPTLLVHGWNDPVIPRDSSIRLMDVLPQADLHSFGRCGHWVMIEHTAAFNGVVRSFLES